MMHLLLIHLSEGPTVYSHRLRAQLQLLEADMVIARAMAAFMVNESIFCKTVATFDFNVLNLPLCSCLQPLLSSPRPLLFKLSVLCPVMRFCVSI